jgi:proteic killer suppression protein
LRYTSFYTFKNNENKMIRSFRCKETKKIYDGFLSRQFPAQIQQRARRKLRMLNSSKVLDDLKIPPSNHLEKLVGDRVAQYRVNDQWRICFMWNDGIVTEVEIIDYH